MLDILQVISGSCLFQNLQYLQQSATIKRPKLLRYPFGIKTQQGESETMDSPFLFSQNRHFRAFGLTTNL